MPRIQAKGINERPHSRTQRTILQRIRTLLNGYSREQGKRNYPDCFVHLDKRMICGHSRSKSNRADYEKFYVRRNRPETRSALVGLAEKEGIGNILLSTYACRSFQVSNRNLVALRGMLVLEDGAPDKAANVREMTREIILKENISIPASNNQKWLYSSRGSQEEQEERNNEPVI
ncbi:hypothetical protein M752DRAFT_301248 [Aspergillus phoenicis ATCC 13157]|uniref:Uncharacterized protein n=2 Tax=Aspergillus TaxID=5052 RepID=A0A370PIB6_ASPPH|nr:hypothetical protein M747DRAFT_301186 [Aspergillus niger ATCC 13496]RDK41941.1 hypothetical protein M752DRAFT_301248 [Aspergillus phoenicis ATCC 13157]